PANIGSHVLSLAQAVALQQLNAQLANKTRQRLIPRNMRDDAAFAHKPERAAEKDSTACLRGRARMQSLLRLQPFVRRFVLPYCARNRSHTNRNIPRTVAALKRQQEAAKSMFAPQKFANFLVVDFEATCRRDGPPPYPQLSDFCVEVSCLLDKQVAYPGKSTCPYLSYSTQVHLSTIVG
ncbi:hypothetical protein BIW11_12660, partial [Tropilaelaps mercedesae]